MLEWDIEISGMKRKSVGWAGLGRGGSGFRGSDCKVCSRKRLMIHLHHSSFTVQHLPPPLSFPFSFSNFARWDLVFEKEKM